MWLRRVDGDCLSYGAPALPAHLHHLPAPKIEQYIHSIMNHSKYGLKMNCENSSFETTPAQEGRREEVDELTLVTSVIQELCSWGPVNHISSILEITAGVLGTLDVIFWWSAVAIKDHNDLLGAAAQMMHIVQITVCDLLPGLLLFPLHHVEKPSTINHQRAAELVSQVKWIS